MRLSSWGMMVAAVLAAPAIAAPTPSGTPAAVDPRAGLPAAHRPAHALSAAGTQQVPQVQHHVDLNRASRKELMTLPGIGADDADRIIAHRPYLSKGDLVAKNALPIGPFVSIRHLVVALPTNLSKGRP